MSPRQWCALFCFYTAYLFFGASVFYYTEREYEVERRLHELQERIEIHELLAKYTAPDDLDIQEDILGKVTTYCGKKVTNHTLDEHIDPYHWTFYHSVFFAFTVCSTLGYGNIAPTQTFGRYFMIVYALVGIPVNGILYAYLGDYFGETFIGAYNRYKDFKLASNKNYVPHRWNMIAQITLYLVPAAVVLIFLPSCLFTYFEGWSYSVSVYYSFVTLSTIGFGDFIPTFQPHQERVFGWWFQLYQAFIIIWLVFGLSYLLMLIGFIARGMRSKQITRLEHQLSENIKLTQQRIWTGVTKDVSYLRKIFNEIYIMRFKPAYDEDADGYVYNILTRSESCPNLAMYHPHYAHHHHYSSHHYHNHHPQRYTGFCGRRRAHSEHDISTSDASADLQSPTRDPNVTGSNAPTTSDGQPPTRRSDADLLRCDRPRALNDPLLSIVHTGDVLARVVQALGAIGDRSNLRLRHSLAGGYHGLSDADILADESGQSECATPPLRPRMRAASAAPVPQKGADGTPHEWTWTGTHSQMAELRQMRARINGGNGNGASDLLRQAVTGAAQAVSIEISPPTSAGEEEPVAAAADTPRSHRKPSLGFARNLLTGHRPERKVSGGQADEMERVPFEPPPDARRYLEATGGRGGGRGARDSVHTDAVRRQYQNATNRGRPSVFAAIDTAGQQVLEQTTIADLLRAIEVAHIQENVPESVLLGSSLMRRSPRPADPRSEQIGAAGGGRRRASMFPGFHSCHAPHGERLQRLLQTDIETTTDEEAEESHAESVEGDGQSEDDDSDDGPPEPPSSALFHKHPKSRRASMFPANFREFKKLTDTILSEVPQTDEEQPSPELSPLPVGVRFQQRRASMAPARRQQPLLAGMSPPPLKSSIATHQRGGGGGGGAGRRVSLIPGAGRHAIPERLLREYAHVPRETHALSRQAAASRASGRQPRQFLSAPIGGAFAMPISPARRRSSGKAGQGGRAIGVSPLAQTAAVSATTTLLRDAITTASSPHLSAVRRDSVQLGVPPSFGARSQEQRSSVRHHVFRPLQDASGAATTTATSTVAEQEHATDSNDGDE